MRMQLSSSLHSICSTCNTRFEQHVRNACTRATYYVAATLLFADSLGCLRNAVGIKSKVMRSLLLERLRKPSAIEAHSRKIL